MKTFLHTPGIKILGIADLDLQSPGIQLARKHGIFTTRNFHDLLSKPGKKIVFDATGNAAVAAELASAASETTVVVPPEGARLIWELVTAREQVNRQLMAESSSLLTFIEQGLAHIETLHSQHGQVLKEVADEIRALSELAAESQLLVQEAEAVMGIIGNVATQTRILGINASIESARTGELGRGFAVVADAIHKLSADHQLGKLSGRSHGEDARRAGKHGQQRTQGGAGGPRSRSPARATGARAPHCPGRNGAQRGKAGRTSWREAEKKQPGGISLQAAFPAWVSRLAPQQAADVGIAELPSQIIQFLKGVHDLLTLFHGYPQGQGLGDERGHN